MVSSGNAEVTRINSRHFRGYDNADQLQDAEDAEDTEPEPTEEEVRAANEREKAVDIRADELVAEALELQLAQEEANDGLGIVRAVVVAAVLPTNGRVVRRSVRRPAPTSLNKSKTYEGQSDAASSDDSDDPEFK